MLLLSVLLSFVAIVLLLPACCYCLFTTVENIHFHFHSRPCLVCVKKLIKGNLGNSHFDRLWKYFRRSIAGRVLAASGIFNAIMTLFIEIYAEGTPMSSSVVSLFILSKDMCSHVYTHTCVLNQRPRTHTHNKFIYKGHASP